MIDLLANGVVLGVVWILFDRWLARRGAPAEDRWADNVRPLRSARGRLKRIVARRG